MIQFDNYIQFIKVRHEVKRRYFLMTLKDKWQYKRALYQKPIHEDLLDLIWEYLNNDISNKTLRRNYGKAKQYGFHRN